MRFRDVIKQFYKINSDDRKETHYLLDGGKLVIPMEQDSDFLRTYADFVQQGGRAFVVSLRTAPTFRMFFDLDVHVTEPQQPEWFAAIGKYVLSAVCEMLEASDDLHLVMCATDIKRTTKGGKDCIKHGIHVHLPALHVNKETAQQLRNGVVQKLSNHMGPRASPSGPTTWADDVDAAVFESNGLRMLYSRKMVACPECKGRKREGCPACLGDGRADEGRAYTPLLQIDADYRIHDLESADALRMLHETSIRSDRVVQSHALHATPPCWLEVPDLIAPARAKRSRRPKKFTELGRLDEGVAEVESGLSNRVKLTAEQLHDLQRWVAKLARQGRLPKQYAGVEMDGFTCTVHGSRCLAFVRLASSYCSNIGREHTTNTVYLEIDGRMQLCHCRCFCRCDTVEGRRARSASGLPVRCKEYRSAPCGAREVQQVLFPDVVHVNYLAQPDLFANM